MSHDETSAESVKALLDTMPKRGESLTSPVSQKRLEDALNEAQGVEGWAMQSIPWTTEQAWNTFLEIVDSNEIIIVSLGKSLKGSDQMRQGIVLVSPNGMDNLKASNQGQK